MQMSYALPNLISMLIILPPHSALYSIYPCRQHNGFNWAFYHFAYKAYLTQAPQQIYLLKPRRMYKASSRSFTVIVEEMMDHISDGETSGQWGGGQC